MQNEVNELASILEFTVSRAKSGQMSLEEVNSWLEMLLERSVLWASVQELADFYHQSEHNVRCLINRRYVGKPKRRVYYSFNQFSKIVPKSWICHKETIDSQSAKENN